uniref:upstream activation factor subunit UAF30-like n=1 Tax=Fragaria vesca subsp. vesca TaxID=101020 RepID=UPI0005C8E456|nr:PREDICTED: upstream activation factor subunit UAF30-like [Fragaria vesca subsp. vesca]
MATEQEISQALEALVHDGPTSFTTLNDVVQQLQSKLACHDLSHKADFIRSQIHFLLRSHPPPQQSPKDHFALQQNPNCHPAPSSAFQTFASPKPEPITTPVPASDPPKDGSKPKPKRKGGPGGLNKLCGVSPELQVIVGHPTLPRTEIVKQLWAYIRKHNLQDPGNKRKIICNDELRLVFETDCTDMFKMNKLLAKHIIALEPSSMYLV